MGAPRSGDGRREAGRGRRLALLAAVSAALGVLLLSLAWASTRARTEDRAAGPVVAEPHAGDPADAERGTAKGHASAAGARREVALLAPRVQGEPTRVAAGAAPPEPTRPAAVPFRATRVEQRERPGFPVRGRVSLPDGTGVPDQTLTLTTSAAYEVGDARSDGEGRFRFEGVPAGRAWIRLADSALPEGWIAPLHGGRDLLRFDVAAQAAGELELVLERGVRLTGRVLWSEATAGAGRTPAGDEVVARCLTPGLHHVRSTQVAADGLFELEGLHRASYAVRVRPGARIGVGWGAPPERVVNLSLAGGREPGFDAGDFVLGVQTGAVRGRLLTEADRPLANGLVLCFSADRYGNCLIEQPAATCRSDADGGFVLEGLGPGGYCLRVEKTHGGGVVRFELGVGERVDLGGVGGD